MRIVVVALLCLISLAARAQSLTAFTFQGELKSDGANYNGAADLRFRLFDSASGGSEIGPQVTVPSVPVSGGRFTTMLDFGSVFRAGVQGYIEMDVRTPAGSGSFTTLAGRQAVSSTPLAQGIAGVVLTPSAEVVDQFQTSVSAFVSLNTSVNYQAFVAGVSGTLTGVELYVLGNGLPVTVQVYEGSGASGKLLASVTNGSGPTGARRFTLPPVQILAGATYTLGISGAGSIGYSQSASYAIPGVPYNWYFRTFVTPMPALKVKALEADSVKWSNVAGVPANVANPPLVFSFVRESLTPQNSSETSPSLISGASADFTLQKGVAIINWSLSCYTNFGSTAFAFRVRVINQDGIATYSPLKQFYFNTPGQHQSISGTVTMNVEAGTQSVALVQNRTTGVGAFSVDSFDSLSFTILNVRQ
ncbi:MAG: hypothetical protein U0573_03215 [Phycisphaerales bacterium]|nr:hypothetical protein [Planctomycetota bacterium]